MRKAPRYHEAMLAERGWEATTVQAIQRRAGISQGSWQHAFPDGEVQAAAEIFDGIHREVWPGVLEPFESGGRKDAAAVIDGSLARLFAYAGDYPARLRLFVSLQHFLLQGGRADMVRANNAEIERTLASWPGKVFDAPSDDGKGGAVAAADRVQPRPYYPSWRRRVGRDGPSRSTDRCARRCCVRRRAATLRPTAAAEGTAGSTVAARHKW